MAGAPGWLRDGSGQGDGQGHGDGRGHGGPHVDRAERSGNVQAIGLTSR